MAYSSIVAASKPLPLHQNPNLPNTSKPSLFASPNSNSLSISLPSHLCFPSLKLKTPKSRVYATSSSSFPTTPSTLLSNSTRSISSIISLVLSISKIISTSIHQIPLKLGPILPTPDELASIQSMKQNLVCTMGPLFFAAMRPGSPRLNTPLTVVAAGMAKWLEIYGGLLMVRVLLSWFPNIPWDRQPLSAIRDLCDPYLNLFRNIIPPIFDTLDVSPLLAFAVMGIMGSILSSSSLA